MSMDFEKAMHILKGKTTMRLWSIHPRYLDTIGLVACWRESLLARKVLQGETRGYKNHPQLERFKTQERFQTQPGPAGDPVGLLNSYLLGLFEEAVRRGFNFDRGKIGALSSGIKIAVSDGQMRYELDHLSNKLKTRSTEQYTRLAGITTPDPHPLFEVYSGGIEPWERKRG